MNENNKVFELSDEELAKVVGGQRDTVPTVEPPKAPPPLDDPFDGSIPSTLDHCELAFITSGLSKCPRAADQRTAVACPVCYLRNT